MSLRTTSEHTTIRVAAIATSVALSSLIALQLAAKERLSDKTASDGNVYYVSPDGRGDGTDPAKPGTIAGILPMLEGGDAMLLLSGEYLASAPREGKSPPIININKYFRFASAPTKDKPIRIAAARGHKPVLKGNGKGLGILCDSRHSHNMIIEGLVFQNFRQAGIRVGYDVPQENITIRGCDFSGIHCNDNMGGVFIHSSSSVTVEHCVFHDFFYSRGGRENQGVGMVIFRGRDLTIRKNEFRNLQRGLYYKHGEPTTGSGGFTRITGNLFHHIRGAGAGTNQNRTEFTNNVFDGCSLAVHNEDGTLADFTFDVKIHNNTFIDTALSLARGSEFSGAQNASIKQNIFFRSALRIWPYGSDEAFGKGIRLVSDDNCYWYPGKEQVIEYFSSTTPAFHGVKTGGTYELDEWKRLGYGADSIELNPLFLDEEKRDYRLMKNTKCPMMGAFPLK